MNDKKKDIKSDRKDILDLLNEIQEDTALLLKLIQECREDS